MITDLNAYRCKQKFIHINGLIKQLMAVRADLQRLKIEEYQLRHAIKELARELELS